MRALDEYLELHDTKEELEHEMAVIENSIKEVNDSYGKQRRDLAYYVDKDLPKKYRAEHQTVAVRQLDEVKWGKADYAKLKQAHEQEEKALSQQQWNKQDEKNTLENRLAEKMAELSKEQLLDFIHNQQDQSKKRKREDEAGGGE
jgi:hypothetical protein